MRNFSNTYIFVFSLIMVVIVAVLLSFVALQLGPRQEMNVQNERKQDILRSVGEAQNAGDAPDKMAYIDEEFKKLISETYVINFMGEKVESDAFEITLKIKEQIAKPVEERLLPVFLYKSAQGDQKYILPVLGKGLWGPVWGYVSFDDDMNTIYGAVFDHKGETPGLGSEINTEWFQEPFTGKTIFDENGEFVSIEVVKGGADPSDPHGVDAISGGTITSKGLEAMLMDCLAGYVNHFKELAASE